MFCWLHARVRNRKRVFRKCISPIPSKTYNIYSSIGFACEVRTKQHKPVNFWAFYYYYLHFQATRARLYVIYWMPKIYLTRLYTQNIFTYHQYELVIFAILFIGLHIDCRLFVAACCCLFFSLQVFSTYPNKTRIRKMLRGCILR